MKINIGDLKPVRFYLYNYAVTHNIITMNDDCLYYKKEFARIFSETLDNGMSYYKIVYECLSNNSPVFVGFSDHKITIGFGMEKVF